MRVLVACERSGIVRDAFAKLGHDAWSVDLEPTMTPGQHFQGSIFDCEHYLNNLGDFDLIIAHPPCTAVAVSGNAHYANTQARLDGIEFIRRVWELPCKRMALENPVGVINTALPDMPRPQYIQPYNFGHDASKRTGLWLRGLPELRMAKYIEPRIIDGKGRWANQTDSGQNNLGPSADRAMIRATTYQGIADAMAEQWGAYVENQLGKERPMSQDATKLITAYVAMRDDLAVQKKVFDTFAKTRKEDMLKIADALQKLMDASGGVESLRTDAGTAFKATKDFISVGDWNQFLEATVRSSLADYKEVSVTIDELVQSILDSGVFSFFNKAVNKAVTKEYMDDHDGMTPPGLIYGTKVEIQIRKPTK